MEKSNQFLVTFSNLLKGDFEALSDFENLKLDEIRLFFNGKLYWSTLNELLQNYIENGKKAFQTIDGDFLCIVVEPEKIMVVRDRHGAGSQLFYSNEYISNSLLSFAGIDGFECKPNHEALLTFMSIGYIPSPLTSLQGVSKLNAGFVLEYKNNQIKTSDLFDYNSFMQNVGTSKLTIEEAVIEYEKLHKSAIENRIKSAKKVGLLLSGGYDSGGNISALRDVYQGDVVSYSIGFKDNPWTELPLSKILSERYKSRHYDYEIDGSEIMQLPQILRATGDPFQEGGLLVNFTVMQLVKKSSEQPDIILGGDGNDQHFGTSGKELAMHWKLKSKGVQFLQKWFDTLGDSISSFDKDSILFRTEFHNRKILHIQQSDTFGFSLRKLNNMTLKGINIKKLHYLQNAPKSYKNFDDFFYNRNYNIDIKQVINEVILFKSSRMSELFGNKISFPYMSTDLYNFLNKMPVNYKFKGTLDELSGGKGVSKYLHKTYLKPKLPTEITDRKKQGGFAPLPIFLKDDTQRRALFAYLRKADGVKAIFKIDKIESLLNQYETIATSKSYWFWYQQVKANQIINLLTLAVWWEMYINKKTNLQNINELM
ncbi:MAG: asparagine synthase-related protein [Paludibacter sp.]